jgi:hypothetical protein
MCLSTEFLRAHFRSRVDSQVIFPNFTNCNCSKFRKQENKPQNNFVTTTTLLEPNNVIPSWEFGGEEKKEVSVTMRKLRQQYD